MADIKNTFQSGTMNKDLDERLVEQGQYRDALNVTVGTSESSDIGAVQNSLGNEKINDLYSVAFDKTFIGNWTGSIAYLTNETVRYNGVTYLCILNVGITSSTPDVDVSHWQVTPVLNAKCIGTKTYSADRVIFYFISSDLFDGVYEYNDTLGETTRVLQSNKPIPTDISLLNFSANYIITGVNYINGLLLWTDNYNPPRKINVSRCKSYLVDDARIIEDISLIKRPPLFAPSIELKFDNTQSTNLEEKFISFAYRYKYNDNEYSSISPLSSIAFFPKDYVFDYAVGNNKTMINKYNAAKVTFLTGGINVTDIQLLMYDTRSLNMYIIENFNKFDLNIESNYSYNFTFLNNKIYVALPSKQPTRLFDNVPLKAKAQDIIGSRLIFGGITQFYDIDVKGGVNFTLDLISEDVIETEARRTFRSDRDYELGVVYKDDYARQSTVMVSKKNTIYIPPTNSDKANSIKININSEAPSWAKMYSFVIKQGKEEYYNIFPLLFYGEGLYRHFLINTSDVDKFKVGEYIICKAASGSPTYSNKKYKILEIDTKVANSIPGNSNVAGVYFKIKVDSQAEFNVNQLTIYSNLESRGGNYRSNDNAFSDPIPWEGNGYIDKPIFYGTGANTLIIPAIPYSGSRDYRYTIKIVSVTATEIKIEYTDNIFEGSPIETGVVIQANTDINLKYPSSTSIIGVIQFSSLSGLKLGDKWKVMFRANYHLGGNYLGGVGLPQSTWLEDEAGGYAVITAGTGVKEIFPGAKVEIQIVSDEANGDGLPNTGNQVFLPSPGFFENIEEWFIESGALNQFYQVNDGGSNIGNNGINFRRGIEVYAPFESWNNSNCAILDQVSSADLFAPPQVYWDYNMHMIIQGFAKSPNNQNSNKAATLNCSFKVSQLKSSILFETEGKPNDLDIFHECTRTMPIINKKHTVSWKFDDGGYNTLGTSLYQIDYNDRYPHYFNVGDPITVIHPQPFLNGTFNVVAVPDAYTVIIDLPHVSFPVQGGIAYYDSVYDKDQTATTPASFLLNYVDIDNTDFNCFSFGNGLETERVRDDFNKPFLKYSLRSSSAIEDYQEVTNENELTYSEIYQGTSSLNGLNEFNLSRANFKYLDKSFGGIQKLHARDTDLVVFQENKVSFVLYGKNLLSDSTGGGSVSSIPEVLGTQIAYPGEYGISLNPESFSAWGDILYWTDARRGVVLQMAGKEITEISAAWMKDYFRDMFRAGVHTQKLGAFDPYRQNYVISTNNKSSQSCELKIYPEEYVVGYLANTTNNVFKITTNAAWSISLLNIGWGTSWVTDITPDYGVGDAYISVTTTLNSTSSARRVGLKITFCNGQEKVFVLVQSRGKRITLGIFAVKDKFRL